MSPPAVFISRAIVKLIQRVAATHLQIHWATVLSSPKLIGSLAKLRIRRDS